MKQIYLDYAAATPVDQPVYRAMEPYFYKNFYNPSAIYLNSKSVKQDIEQARSNVAGLLGARSSEVIFTSGGTEANNLALKGILNTYPKKHLLVSAIEHDSVLKPAKQFTYDSLPVNREGLVRLDKLKSLIKPDTVLISVMYANNEVGTIQPIKEIAKIIKEVKLSRKKTGNQTPLFFHTDACQAPLYLDINVYKLGVDLMSINAGKIYGPKGCGALFVKTGVDISPQILGGGQELGQRSGTENAALIIGFAKALELATKNRDKNTKKVKTTRDYFLSEIKSQLPNATINGSINNRLANNVHVTFPGLDNERLIMELDEVGVMCGSGSACSASKETSSHVLRAMGLSDELAYSSLRFSLGISTTKSDIDTVIHHLKNLV